jgi:hypothetical protein
MMSIGGVFAPFSSFVAMTVDFSSASFRVYDDFGCRYSGCC